MKTRTVLLISLVAAMALCLSANTYAKEWEFVPKVKDFYYLFGGGTPVLKISPGDRVRLWTEDAAQGRVKSKEDIFSKAMAPIWPSVNPQTGPIYVEGAEPGDTLVLKIVDIQPAVEQGWSCFVPKFGFLTETRFTSMLHDPLPEITWIYPIDKYKGTVKFVSHLGPEKYEVEIAMHPFVGTIGTAPSDGERFHSLTPYFHGGNMDCVETKVGTTVYLPVNVAGAMWSTGDVHLAQGDGETCGVAVEAAAWVTIDVLPLIKGKKVGTPRFENEEYIMSAGSARPADDAIRIAYVDMVNWLVEDYGFDKWDAYQLCTQVATIRVGNIVDTYYTFVVKFPKKYLPQ